jgi:rhodanese-related sulfurtransferase
VEDATQTGPEDPGGAGGGRAKTLSPEQAREMLGSNEASAIDIRGDDEWGSGRIPGARHRSEEEIDDALEQIAEGQTVIVACEDGELSARIAEQIAEGGREAASIEGGMEAWRSQDMPMQPSYDPDDESTI